MSTEPFPNENKPPADQHYVSSIRLILLFGMIVLILSGACMRQEPENKPRLEIGTPTATPSQTATPNPTERYQATLQANQTQNAIREATRAAYAAGSAATATARALTPTATPTATPLPEWALNGPEEYVLAEVDAAVLVDFLIETYGSRPDWIDCYLLPDGCWLEDFLYTDSKALLDLLEAQSKEPAPAELAEALIAYSGTFQGGDLMNIDWWQRTEIYDVALRELVVSQLNEEKIHLVDGQPIETDLFISSVQQGDFDDDSETEWLLQVYIEKYDFLSWILVDESPEGEFSQIDFPFGKRQLYFTSQEIARIEDVTGDFKDEIIFINDYYIGGANILQFSIHTFREGVPQLISKIDDIGRGLLDPHMEYEWIGHPVHGLSGLSFEWTAYYGWGCAENGSAQVFWQDGEEQRVDHPIGEPETFSCLIARSLETYYGPSDDTAIRWLEKTLAIDSTSRELSSMERTFIYFRLAMLYLRKGASGAAGIYLARIQAQAASGETEFAARLWNEVSQLIDANRLNPYTLCAASVRISEVLANVNTRGEILSYEYAGGASFPDPLCPPWPAQLEALEQITLDDNLDSLVNAAMDKGLPVIDAHAFQLGGGDSAWLIVLQNLEFTVQSPMLYPGEAGDPGLRIFGKGPDDDWRHLIYLTTSEDYQSISEDWNGDGLPELGFASSQPGNDYSCQPGDLAYEVFWISAFLEGVTVSAHEYAYCFPENQPFDWHQIAEDRNGDHLSDWAFDIIFQYWDDIERIVTNEPADGWLYGTNDLDIITKASILSDLDARTLESGDPAEIRTEILAQMGAWSDEAPVLKDALLTHLTYLLGLTYELEGNETRAVAIYHRLWSTWPDSAWGRLAAARLTLKP